MPKKKNSKDNDGYSIQNLKKVLLDLIYNTISTFDPATFNDTGPADPKWDFLFKIIKDFISKKQVLLGLVYDYLNTIDPTTLTGIDPARAKEMLRIVLLSWWSGKNEQEQDMSRSAALRWAGELEAQNFPSVRFFRNICYAIIEYTQHINGQPNP